MMNLLKRIEQAKHDPTEMEYLLAEFKPLLNKYARKLKYEDAYSDMQLLFIQMLQKIDTTHFPEDETQYILSYIAKTTYKFFLRCIMKNRYSQFEIQESSIPEFQIENLKNLSFSDFYRGLLLEDLQHILYDDEYKIIYDRFIDSKKIQEIADKMGISKQAVSAKKKRALEKIRKYFCE